VVKVDTPDSAPTEDAEESPGANAQATISITPQAEPAKLSPAPSPSAPAAARTTEQ
jgi:hypothetical protein